MIITVCQTLVFNVLVHCFGGLKDSRKASGKPVGEWVRGPKNKRKKKEKKSGQKGKKKTERKWRNKGPLNSNRDP